MSSLPEEPKRPVKPSHRRRKFFIATGLLLIAFLIANGIYFSSQHFHNHVRQLVTAYLEQVTGGKVEMGDFQWDLSHLEFQIHNLTIHGLEGENEVPYAHVELMVVRLKIISMLERRVDLDYLKVQQPLVHLIVYPDGTTNQPHGSNVPTDNQAAVRQLFEIAVNRLDVSHGAMLFAERRIPLDFSADGVNAEMEYSKSARRYSGVVHCEKLDTTLKDWRPFASTADARFSLFPDHVEVQSLKWSSGNSWLSAAGSISRFDHPVVNANYQGNFDLREIAANARNRELARGNVVLDGKLGYSDSRYLSTGTLRLSNLEYRSPSLRLLNAAVDSDFKATPTDLTLSDVQARALGGTVRGDIAVTNWGKLNSEAALRTASSADEQRGTARLRIQNVRVGDLISASAKARKLERLRIAGLLSGTVDGSWRGSPERAEAKLALDVTAPGRISSGELPLTAKLQGIYRGSSEQLQISQLEASTPATDLQASGTLGSYTAKLNLSVANRDIAEIQPLLPLLTRYQELPLNVQGEATFTGTLNGKLSAPQVAGQLKLTNFDTTEGSSHNSDQQKPHTVHWDLLSTNFQLASSSLRAHQGILRRGQAALNFDLTTALQRYAFTRDSQFNGHLGIQGAQATDLEAISGYEYPVSGTVNLSLQASGTQRDLQGDGNVAVQNGSIYGHAFESFTSKVKLAHQEIQLNEIRVTQRQASLNGDVAYNFQSAAFRIKVNGSNFDLARVKVRQMPNLDLKGRLDFHAEGSGTRQAPVLNGTIRLNNIVADQEKIGNFVLEAAAKGPNLRLTGRSDFREAALALDGTVYLRDDFPIDLTAHFSRLDVDPLLRVYLHGRITGHSATEGTIRFIGPLKHPREIAVTGDLSDFSVGVEGIAIHNSGPIRFGVAQQVLTLQSLRLMGNDTDISAAGTLQLTEPRRLNLNANGQVNLKIVQSLSSNYTSSGIVTVALKVGGTVDTPNLVGQIQIANGSLNEIDLPSGLSDVNGTLVFNQNQLRVQSLTAHTGGGILTLGGYITYGRKINFNLTANGKDVRLRYPPGMSTTADISLNLVGSLTNSILSGDITVNRFALSPNLDLASYVARAKQPAMLPNPNSPLNNLRLDVHITTIPELQVQTSLAKVTGDADLRIRGTAARPVVLGRVNIAQAEVSFNGTKYHLERGDILFIKPVPPIEPVLDLEAAARVRDYDIRVGFHGPIDKLGVTYNSDPPLPTADIIALLAMGRTREESAMLESPETTFAQTASNAILGEALNSTVSNRLEKLFGVSRIKIDPQAGGAENNPTGTRVTVEQQFSNNLTLTYITNVSEASQQIIEAEYFINRNVSIVGLRDQNGVVSFDIRIRQRKK